MNIGFQMLGRVKYWSCTVGTLILFIFAPGILLLGFLAGQLGDVKFWNGSGTIFILLLVTSVICLFIGWVIPESPQVVENTAPSNSWDDEVTVPLV